MPRKQGKAAHELGWARSYPPLFTRSFVRWRGVCRDGATRATSAFRRPRTTSHRCGSSATGATPCWRWPPAWWPAFGAGAPGPGRRGCSAGIPWTAVGWSRCARPRGPSTAAPWGSATNMKPNQDEVECVRKPLLLKATSCQCFLKPTLSLNQALIQQLVNFSTAVCLIHYQSFWTCGRFANHATVAQWLITTRNKLPFLIRHAISWRIY